MSYTAVTPNWNAWKFYVKDTKTGENEWLSSDIVLPDSPDFDGPGRYKSIQSIFSDKSGLWFVQVTDKNGKNVGQIYVDADNGKVLKVTIPQQKSQIKTSKLANTINVTNTTNSTGTTNDTVPISQGSSDNNTGIISIIALIIATGAGYFIYTKIWG